MTAMSTQLGPKARAALARAIEAAVQAVRSDRSVSAARHVEYALNLVETAMVVDAAEAEAHAQDPHA